MKTIKVKNLFCLPEWSILIGRYAATGLQYFLKLGYVPCKQTGFTLVLIKVICTAYLLVFKHTDQKKVDFLNQTSLEIDKILAISIALWLVDWMQPFFKAWADFTASKHWFLKQQFLKLNWLEHWFFICFNECLSSNLNPRQNMLEVLETSSYIWRIIINCWSAGTFGNAS